MRCSFCERKSVGVFITIPLCDACMHAFVCGMMVNRATDGKLSKSVVEEAAKHVSMKVVQ